MMPLDQRELARQGQTLDPGLFAPGAPVVRLRHSEHELHGQATARIAGALAGMVCT
ncbi:MAG TPA: hypothetical protein VGI67_17330 [Thermoleophilaceae bacterium]